MKKDVWMNRVDKDKTITMCLLVVCSLLLITSCDKQTIANSVTEKVAEAGNNNMSKMDSYYYVGPPEHQGFIRTVIREEGGDFELVDWNNRTILCDCERINPFGADCIYTVGSAIKKGGACFTFELPIIQGDSVKIVHVFNTDILDVSEVYYGHFVKIYSQNGCGIADVYGKTIVPPIYSCCEWKSIWTYDACFAEIFVCRTENGKFEVYRYPSRYTGKIHVAAHNAIVSYMDEEVWLMPENGIPAGPYKYVSDIPEDNTCFLRFIDMEGEEGYINIQTGETVDPEL